MSAQKHSNSIVTSIIPCFIGITLVVAAAIKLYSPSEFFMYLRETLPVAGNASRMVGSGIIVFELAIGAGLLLWPRSLIALIPGLAFVASLCAYAIYILVLHPESSCPCFGDRLTTNAQSTAIRSHLMLFALCAGIALNRLELRARVGPNALDKGDS